MNLGKRGGEGEMCGKSNMETYIIICKIDSQGEFAVWLRNSNRSSVSPYRGGMGRKMGGKFQRGFSGAAVKRYPMPKVRETQVRR